VEIGDKVIILIGAYKGSIGIYQGKQNNSNWHIIDVSGEKQFMNLEEFKLM
jgi:hypothetical protein